MIAYIAALIISWSSGRTLNHCWHIIGPILVALAGAVIMISTLNTGARYFSLVLLCTGPFVGLNVSTMLFSQLICSGKETIEVLILALDPNILGNNSRPTPKSKTSGPDSYRQLCLVSISLVYPVSLPSLAGA